MPEDDPGPRSRTLPYRWDAAIGQVIAIGPLTVRIDLDDEQPRAIRRRPVCLPNELC